MATVTPGVIIPNSAAGWSVPGGNATAPTTPYSGTFIPTLWSGKLAKKFYDVCVLSEISNTDYQGEIANMGDKVIINTIPDISINDYTIGGPLNYEVPNGKTITLTIDRAKSWSVAVNDVLAHQSKFTLMDKFTDDAAIRLKQAIERDVIYRVFFKADGSWNTTADKKQIDQIWNVNTGKTAGRISGAYDVGTDADPVALTGENILEKITQLSSILDEVNVPEEGRFLVLTPYERWVLMQSPLANAQFIGDPKSMIRNGRIGTIDRFTVYVNNMLPKAAEGKAWDNSTASAKAKKRHLIFAGHKSAITFASQITNTEHLRNPNDFGDLVRGLSVYGSGIIQGHGLVPMVVDETVAEVAT